MSRRDELFWCELLAEGAAEQTITIDNLEKMRFTRWLAAREDAMDEDGPASNYKPSDECKADMQKHGAKNFGDLVFLDQSLFLGRPAGKGDMVDAEYGMPPSKSKPQ